MDNLDLNLLENHIDEPIKKSVVGLALLGFTPIFSCCGFTYKEEKVRKTHMWNKPYIYLDHQKMDGRLKAMLLDIAIYSDWKINTLYNSSYIDFHSVGWNANHPWNQDGCPHKPEVMVLSLNCLEKVLTRYKEYFKEKVKIRDGNLIYKEDLKIKHWQYEPAQDWEVTPEVFDSL